MMEEFKKIFLLGIGAASITYEKSMEIINDMVKKGKLTLEEGKQIGDELRKTMKEKASIINDNKVNLIITLSSYLLLLKLKDILYR